MTTEEKRIGSGHQTDTKLEGWIISFFGECVLLCGCVVLYCALLCCIVLCTGIHCSVGAMTTLRSHTN